MKKLILTLALVAIGTVAHAQQADITASATIIEDLTVTAGANLAFGDIARDVAATIAYNAAGAGTFTVSGTPNVEVEVTLTLPSVLTSSEGADLTFTATAGIDTADLDPTSGTAFTTSPATPQVENLNSNGDLFVSVGGSVTPGVTHIGVYTGTITLAAVYN